MYSTSLKFRFSNFFIRFRNKYLIAEMLFNDKKWREAKIYIGENYTWYVLTPANYDYCKSVYNLKVEKKDFYEILKARIKYLKKMDEKIELCLFLGKIKSFLDEKHQREVFGEGFNFMKSLGINLEKIHVIDNVFDKTTLKIANDHGLQLQEFSPWVNPFIRILIKKFHIKEPFFYNIFRYFKRKEYKNIVELLLGELIIVREKTIHVEILVNNTVWNNLKQHVLNKNYTWFILTPVNYEYSCQYFNLKISKKEFKRILKKRILFLKDHGEDIQLHIHLNKDPELLDRNIQENQFKEALEFMNSLGINPKKFAPGWWVYNKDTLTIAENYGIKMFYDYTINPLLSETQSNNITIKYVHKYWHDFDFI